MANSSSSETTSSNSHSSRQTGFISTSTSRTSTTLPLNQAAPFPPHLLPFHNHSLMRRVSSKRFGVQTSSRAVDSVRRATSRPMRTRLPFSNIQICSNRMPHTGHPLHLATTMTRQMVLLSSLLTRTSVLPSVHKVRTVASLHQLKDQVPDARARNPTMATL